MHVDSVMKDVKEENRCTCSRMWFFDEDNLNCFAEWKSIFNSCRRCGGGERLVLRHRLILTSFVTLSLLSVIVVDIGCSRLKIKIDHSCRRLSMSFQRGCPHCQLTWVTSATVNV